MTITGFVLITVGTILSFIGTYISDKESEDNLISKISEKNKTIENINENNSKLINQNTELLNSSKEVSSTNNELINQNKEMLARVNKYQEEIEAKNLEIQELKDKVNKVERGIENKITFDGKIETRQGGKTNVSIGEEFVLFSSIIKLSEQQKFLEIIKICDENKSKYPNWYTLHFFKAIGLLNTDIKNKKDEALGLLDYVTINTKGDIEYAIELVTIFSELKEQQRIEKVMEHISKSMIETIEDKDLRNKLLKFKQ